MIPELVIRMKEMRRAMNPYVLMLYEIVYETKPEAVLEIGVRQGQSTRTILSALKQNNKGKLVSIDLNDCSHRIPEELKSFWIPVIGDSHQEETFKKVESVLKTLRASAYDIILIDGDHSYEGVKKDFEMYSKLGNYLVLFHDIQTPQTGVPKFWKELKLPKVSLRHGFAGMGLVNLNE